MLRLSTGLRLLHQTATIMSLRRSSRRSATEAKTSPALSAPPAEPSQAAPEATSASLPEAPAERAPATTMAAPTTPRKRRKIQKDEDNANLPPLTPTPSAIGLMTAPSDTTTRTPRKRTTRPAAPHMTNALLKTPRGSKITAPVPTNGGVLGAGREEGTTTENLLERACAHLIKVDPKLKDVIDKFPCGVFSPEGLAEEVDPFRSLSGGIISQQVSGAAAKSIQNKFIALFNEGVEGPHVFPTPAQVAATDLARLRTAGLSGRKAEYIKGLAEKFANGELSAKMLVEATDEEVLEKLTAVRGLGKWSVEMFACFSLKRMDILSTGDLGVQRGIAAYLGKDIAKLKAKGGNNKWKYLSEQQMLDESAKFAPYRSLFMWYMWRIEDVDTSAMEN